ncbi:hypothetical protein Sango_2851800 [Sesamum angolense]|uniref:Aminotransferase-like plant mobile domain-containing protein n=1 Tax=Sesamum angolense TaxID=2727404 RepID=A0AAE1VWV6_9LAMI|nr:hypothetical protein Sango_2851800 [Sesamum angolense]
MDRKAVYGPRDETVLSQQSQYKSDDILDGDIDEVLQAKRANGNMGTPNRWRASVRNCSRTNNHSMAGILQQYIGFAPEEEALKGSRLQVKLIISHISRVQITPSTPNQSVVQYARAVALHLLRGTMCPDSSGNLVSLLYLAKLEDTEARNYSWGSAVLVFLYRELCNASTKGKAAIDLGLVIRIIPLYPGLGAPRVHMGSIDNNRLLPATPYGAVEL